MCSVFSIRHSTLAVVVSISCAAFAPRPALALEDAAAVKAARQALSESARFPWYDKEKDQIMLADVPLSKPPPKLREWHWVPANRPAAPRAPLDGLQVVVWSLLAGILIFAIILLVRAVLQSRRSGERFRMAHPEQSTAMTDGDRIEKLPFPIRRQHMDLLGEARRSYEAGNYAEAIVYLFGYQLVHLDRNHLLRLAKGKTNRQYLREILSRHQLAMIYEQTMIAFEDVFFGKHALDRVRFETCWHRLDEFHRIVEQAAATGP